MTGTTGTTGRDLLRPDGFLYVSIGDEGGANDQYNSGQRIDNALLAGVLRIDVDRDPAKSHAIRRQPRNPATPPTAGRTAIHRGISSRTTTLAEPDGSPARGVFCDRSPQPAPDDARPGDGRDLVGDVGQGTQEEVSRVVRGGNLQWPYREGTATGQRQTDDPDRDRRGSFPRLRPDRRRMCHRRLCLPRSLHPELRGRYLFGDHVSGRIWSMDTSGPPRW